MATFILDKRKMPCFLSTIIFPIVSYKKASRKNIEYKTVRINLARVRWAKHKGSEKDLGRVGLVTNSGF